MEPLTSARHNTPHHRTRLVLADDRERARRACRALLGSDLDLTVVGVAADGYEAIGLVAREQPDVVLVDLRMPVLDRLQAPLRIKDRWPHVRVLVHSLVI